MNSIKDLFDHLRRESMDRVIVPSKYLKSNMEHIETNNDQVLNNICSKVNRIELIGKEGRELVKYLKENESLEFVFQDNKRTLKIFINSKE